MEKKGFVLNKSNDSPQFNPGPEGRAEGATACIQITKDNLRVSPWHAINQRKRSTRVRIGGAQRKRVVKTNNICPDLVKK